VPSNLTEWKGYRVYRHIRVGSDGSHFFSDLEVRSDAYRGPQRQVLVAGVDTGCLLATSDDEMRKNGPVPWGCGENRAILRCRPRRWTRHSRRPPPRLHPADMDPSSGARCLTRFSRATLPTRLCRYTLVGEESRTQKIGDAKKPGIAPGSILRLPVD
jgi:hypothetical protein